MRRKGKKGIRVCATTDRPTEKKFHSNWLAHTLRASKTDVKRANYGKTLTHFKYRTKSWSAIELNHTDMLMWNSYGKSNWFLNRFNYIFSGVSDENAAADAAHFYQTVILFPCDWKLEWESNLAFQLGCTKPMYLASLQLKRMKWDEKWFAPAFQRWIVCVCMRASERERWRLRKVCLTLRKCSVYFPTVRSSV